MSDKMREALKSARQWIVNGSAPIGWNIDRIDAALAQPKQRGEVEWDRSHPNFPLPTTAPPAPSVSVPDDVAKDAARYRALLNDPRCFNVEVLFRWEWNKAIDTIIATPEVKP